MLHFQFFQPAPALALRGAATARSLALRNLEGFPLNSALTDNPPGAKIYTNFRGETGD